MSHGHQLTSFIFNILGQVMTISISLLSIALTMLTDYLTDYSEFMCVMQVIYKIRFFFLDLTEKFIETIIVNHDEFKHNT